VEEVPELKQIADLKQAGGLQQASGLQVSGNRCPRGAAYAQEEILAPKRVVTATCGIAGMGIGLRDGTSGPAFRPVSIPARVPVKSSVPCPKDQILDLLADIY
jgi:CxxC motif-containing protein